MLTILDVPLQLLTQGQMQCPIVHDYQNGGVRCKHDKTDFRTFVSWNNLPTGATKFSKMLPIRQPLLTIFVIKLTWVSCVVLSLLKDSFKAKVFICIIFTVKVCIVTSVSTQ